MLRHTVAALAALMLVGCAGLGGSNRSGSESDGGASDANSFANKATAQKPTDTELAAYAGHAKYPDMPAKDIRAAAIVSPKSGVMKVFNFDQAPIRNADVWVNKAYVQHIGGIAPQGSVVVKFNELYNGFGKNFTSQSDP